MSHPHSRSFRHDIKSLRKILRKEDLLPSSPEEEYDSLIHRILSSLQHGISKEELEKILHQPLGIEVEKGWVDEKVCEILEYWREGRR